MKQKTIYLLPFCIACGPFLFVYLLTANQNFSFDAITNALACEINEPVRWFHPNHPLYPSLAVLWFRTERALGYMGYAVYSLARFNSVFMAAALGIFYAGLIPRLGKWGAGVTVFVLGSTYSVWHYAVDGIGYGPFVFFAALLIVLLSKWDGKKNIKESDINMLSVLSVLYILAHAIGVFHVFAVAWWLYAGKKKTGGKVAASYLFRVGGLLAVIFALIYLSIPAARKFDFFSWFFGYASHGGVSNIGKSPFWAFDLHGVLVGLWEGWRNCFYLPPGNASPLAVVASHGIGLLLVVATVAGFIKAVKNPKSNSLAILLFLWGFFMMPFLAVWSPGHTGYRMHAFIPIIIGISLVFFRAHRFNHLVGLMGTILLSLNLSGPIITESHIKNNKSYQIMKELDGLVDPGDVVLAARSSTIPGIETLRPYFFPHLKGGTLEGRLLAFKETDLRPLKSRFVELNSKGRDIYWTGDLFDPEVQAIIEQKRALEPGSIGVFVSQFEFEPTFRLQNGVELHRVTGISGQ